MRCPCTKITLVVSKKIEIFDSLSSEFLDISKLVVSSCYVGRLESVYSHENYHSHGILHFNCYGFIKYLLQTIHPSSYETIEQFMYEQSREIPISIDGIPCPFHYAAFFSSLIDYENKYWATFQDIRGILPGDVIVYLPKNYVPKKLVKMPLKATGMHIMLVEQVMFLNENQIQLKIIDCTRFRHSKSDDRLKGGIGSAFLIIHLDGNKTILQWGSRKKRWKKDLFFGRLKNL